MVVSSIRGIRAVDLSQHSVHGKDIEEKASSELVHPKLNNFFTFVNDKPLKIIKAVWPLYLPLQIIGLFNEKAGKWAKAFYGSCWSIVYSCLRPFAKNRKVLLGDSVDAFTKTVHKANEHFRFGMGSLVSLIYGSGALGMLGGLISGRDDLYDNAAHVYMTGMFNQNQVFASMNAADVMKRVAEKDKPEAALEAALKPDVGESKWRPRIEVIDSILFIPNIITRALGTFRLFGMNLSALTEKIVDALACFSYGTWAARFGLLKQEVKTKEGNGNLKPLRQDLKGASKKIDDLLYSTQKKGGLVFSTLLPAVSWAASLCELFGFRELTEKVFKIEGILERLNPTIASWCLRDTFLPDEGK